MSNDATDPKRLVTLLISILLLFLVYPFVEHRPFAPMFLQLLFTGVLVSALFSVSATRHHFLIAVTLVVPSLLLRWLLFWQGGQALATLAEVLSLASLGFASWIVLGDCLRSGRVTAARICGVLAVYMLLGLMWSSLYVLVEQMIPGSFDIPRDALSAHRRTSALVYFSFVTLTTLGYGDLTPVGSAARSLAVVEALCGQLYLAVIVARLIGMHLTVATKRAAGI